MDLEKVIAEQLLEKIKSGDLEKIASRQLDMFLEKVMDDCLSSYGTLKEKLVDKIKKEMEVKIDSIPLEAHTKLVVESIKKRLENHSEEQLKIVDKFVEEAFGGTLESKYSINKIIEEYVKYNEDVEDYHEYFGSEMSLHIEESNGSFIHIKCDPEPERDKYKCRYSLHFHKGKLYSASAPGSSYDDCKKSVFLNVLNGTTNSFSKLMFKLMTKEIEIDLSDLQFIDTSYGDY